MSTTMQHFLSVTVASPESLLLATTQGGKLDGMLAFSAALHSKQQALTYSFRCVRSAHLIDTFKVTSYMAGGSLMVLLVQAVLWGVPRVRARLSAYAPVERMDESNFNHTHPRSYGASRGIAVVTHRVARMLATLSLTGLNVKALLDGYTPLPFLLTMVKSYSSVSTDS